MAVTPALEYAPPFTPTERCAMPIELKKTLVADDDEAVLDFLQAMVDVTGGQ